MKNIQRNLFVLIAAGLCATCAWQWYLQARQLRAVEGLNRRIYGQSAQIQDYTNSRKKADEEINQLQARVAELKKSAASNDSWAIGEKREVARLLSIGDLLTNEISQYKNIVDTLTNKLGTAYNGERELVKQRDEFIGKLNDSIRARNGLASNYNVLVARFNKLQSNAAAASPAADAQK